MNEEQAHKLSGCIAKLRIYADLLGSHQRGEPLPADLADTIPELPERLGRIADQLDALSAAPEDARPAVAQAPSTDPQVQPPAHPRVLLVEDDADTAELTRMQLESVGWTVQEARDGRGALAQLRRRRFQLVLMDTRLPGIDGFEVTAALRAAGGVNRTTRVVGLSASPDAGDRDRAFAVGMDDWIVKPLTRDRAVGLLGEIRP